MPYFALTYDVVEGFADKRLPFRPEHLQQVRDAHARGELVMAGALHEPAGALLVFRAADPAMLKTVKAGDKVKFDTEKVNGQFTVTKIQKVK